MLKRVEALGFERATFPVTIAEVDAGQPIQRTGYSIVAFPVDHRGSTSFGYAIIEEERKGRFNPDLARELGIPEGPLWGCLHRGKSVTLDDGRTIDAANLVGPTRPGRKIAFTGDGRPSASTIDAATDADLLIHEATFSEEESARALETGHSTAKEAALVAAGANVKQLVLTHL